jgi:hypothetical protein
MRGTIRCMDMKTTYKTLVLGKAVMWSIAGVGVFLLVTHSIAQYAFLYWEYRWLDIPMHFLGGVWVGLMGLYAVLHTKMGERYIPAQFRTPLYAALGGALILGLVWEGYEIAFKFFEWGWFPDAYALDTLLDVVMDMLGGVLAWRWYKALQKTQKHMLGN